MKTLGPAAPPDARGRLSAAERQEAIAALATDEAFVEVGRLAARFDVTPQTIRRDLRELEQSGRLARHHGGAAAHRSSTENIGYVDRQVFHRGAKERIAVAAASRIPNRTSLFINIGTTTEAVADALMRHEGLRVITNNLNVATRLSRRPDFEVLIAGGLVRRSDGGVVGEASVEFIDGFRVDYGIIGISAIDPADGTLLDYDAREVRVAQAIMRNARRVMLVADHSKFGRSAMVRLGSLRHVQIFCTDCRPPDPIPALLAEAGGELVVAEEE